MADEEQKKPKIDLKARLGKKTVTTGGPSIPPPMMGPGASIPAPPFASRPANPIPEPEPVRAEPQAIKIEMSDEVMQAQKKGRNKWILVAVATAVVGGVIGTAVGGGMERSKNYQNALAGAGILSEDVDKANAEIERLSEVIKKAKRSLNEGKYPEAEVAALGDINIPFGGTYLAGKGIGLMGAEVNRLLVKFAGDAEAANDQKDRLRRVLSSMRKPVEELLSEKDAPKVRWSVHVAQGPNGPIAGMQPLPTPFLVTSKESGYSWPKDFEIQDGDKKIKLDRYTRGDPTSGSTPQLIPVDPSTHGLVCSNDTLISLSRELTNLELLLAGDKSDPTNEKIGLIDTGSALVERLKHVGGA